MFLCPKKLLMGLLFMLLASSVAFQTVRSVLGGWIATQEGLPKLGGLFVHAVVFMLLSTLIWRYAPFGSSNFEGDEEYEDEEEFGDEEELRRRRKSRRKSNYEEGEEYSDSALRPDLKGRDLSN